MAEKFYIATFGCRTNQADSAAIRETFLESSLQETQAHREADVIVINTCTVTHRSDQQVRQLTRKFRRENSKARILLTGCFAQRDPEKASKLQGVSAIVGNTQKDNLVRIAADLEAGAEARPSLHVDDFRKTRSIDLTPGRIGGRTRPFIKIQDGCDARCTYCIIPSVRGPSRSVPPKELLAQIESLTREGFREVVLTGIHIGTYGMYLQPRCPLDRLLEKIVALPDLGMLRLSSIEPMEMSRRIIDLAASSHRIAPHFHICLQSGSDRILKKMLRPYTSQRFLRIIEEIREKIPEAAIGTDLIAGFPGERDEDHQATVEFVKKAPFTYLHVFPYSVREGTAAAEMADEQVDPATIKERSRQLRRLSAQKNAAFRELFVGRRLRVLTLDKEHEGMREAVSGNYLTLFVDRSIPGNRLAEATVKRWRNGHLVGEDLRILL